MNLYDAAYRELDPQTARWWQIDPVTDDYEEYSPYASMYNNPIQISDPLGNEGQECCKDFFDGVDNALITASGLMNGMVNTLSGGLVSTDPYNFRSKLSLEKQSLYDASVQVGQIGPLIATAGRPSFGEPPVLQSVNGTGIAFPITLKPVIVVPNIPAGERANTEGGENKQRNKPQSVGTPNSSKIEAKDASGKTTKYSTYDNKGKIVKQVEVDKGKPRHGTPGATRKTPTYNKLPDGSVKQGKYQIEPATPQETPPGIRN